MGKKLFFLTLVVVSVACSMDPRGREDGLNLTVLMEGLVPGSEDLSLLAVPNPTPSELAAFECFAVNVTGAGVPSDLHTLNTCTVMDGMHGKGIGLLSKPTTKGNPIVIQNVPSGPGRNIDVFGIYPKVSECGGTGYSSSIVIGAYYLGGTSVDLNDNATVSITAAFSANQSASLACPQNNSMPWAFLGASPATGSLGTIAYPSQVQTTITLINVGSYAATISGSAFSPATHFGYYLGSYPGMGGTCSSTILSGASCTIVLTFSPASPAVGAVNSQLDITYDRGDGGTQTLSIALSGTGT